MGLRSYASQHPYTQQEPQEPEGVPAPPRLISEADVMKDQLRAVEICREYDRREAEAQELAAAIVDGIKAGRQPAELLLLAVKTIDALTGETKGLYPKVFHAMAGAYGAAMFDGELPEVRKAQLETELRRLKRERDKYNGEISRRQQELNALEGSSLFGLTGQPKE